LFSKAQLTQALATYRADLAEKVRGLPEEYIVNEGFVLKKPDVLAILEVGE
jgi:hypothetical protein